MKNLFGIRFEEEQEKGIIEATAFASASVSLQQEKLLEEVTQEMAELEKKGTLSVWLQVVRLIAELGAFICILNFIFRLLEVGFEQAIDEHWVPVLIGLVLIGINVVLLLWQRKRKREITKTMEDTLLEERAESLYQASRQQLGIPSDAVEMDIISTVYRVQSGKEKLLQTQNFSVSVYQQAECLCFADNTQVFSIPLSSIQKLTLVKKRLILPEWNKEEAYNSKTYKPYHIGQDNIGQYIIRRYLSLQISEERGEFEVMVPEYDEKILFSLLPPQIPKEGF